MGKNNETQFTIKVELAGDSKKIQQAIKDGLSKDFTAKVGADTNKFISDINTALKDLNSSGKKVKVGIDSDYLLRDVKRAITSINNDDSIKKLKLGVDVNYLQQQLKNALRSLDTTIKLKTKLETTSKTTDTKGTVTTNKTSKKEADEYQSLFSKRAASIQNLDKVYQEFGKGSQELRKAFKEFYDISKDVRKFGRETGVQSLNQIAKDLERQIGANLSNGFLKNALVKEYEKVNRDKEQLDRTLHPDKYARLDAKARVKQLEAEHADVDAEIKQKKQELTKAIADATKSYTGLKAEKADNAATNKQITDYVNKGFAEHEAWLKQDLSNAQLLEQATANRQKMEHEIAKLKYQQLQAEHADDDATRKQQLLYKKELNAKIAELAKDEVTHQKSVNTALAENLRKSKELEKTEKERLKTEQALALAQSKSSLHSFVQSAKGDKRLDSDKMQKFMDELQNYRNLTGNYRSSFFYDIGRELGINNNHPYFNAMRTLYQSNLRDEAEWRKKPLTANVDVKGSEKVEELNQKVLTTTQQFMRLRGEALKAGNALNQATDPKEVTRLTEEFKKAIQALVNYQRATRGLTKGGEAQLVEKLAVGNIKEQTEAWKVLYEWVKKTVQAQRDYDIGVGRRNPPKSKDTDLMSYFKNIDWGRALSGMAYAARGELNTVQAFGNLLSSMSQISGVVGVLAKGLGAFFAVGLAVAGVINVITSAFTQLTGVLGQVATTIYNILRPGIELYKQRQTAELAVAAAISSRAREEGQQVPFERGLEISKELMQRVIIDAAKSAFNPQELIDALRGTLPLAFGKGMNLEQAYDLTKGVASVAKVINLAPNQVLQELRDILQGTISARSSQVAGATGMTGEELREAEAQGRLYEYISEHLKNFTIALNKYAETLAGALDRLSETWAMGMEAVFSRIAPVFNNLLNAFVDNFIGVYKDKNTGEIIDTSNSENLKNPETGEYRELVPEFSIYIKQFASALEDLIIFIAPIIDEILDFVQELTGQADPINAVTVLIEYAIRIMVTLGEVLAQMIFDMAEALIKWEKPISWLLGLLKGIVKATYHMDEALLEFAATIQNVLFALWKAITRIGSWDDVGKAASEGMNNVTESSKKMVEDIKQGLTTTSYDELLGVDRGERAEKGLVERLVDEAREKANAEADKKAEKPVDYNAVQGMAKENKQNVADLRKAMQAAIEDIKQALKDALAQLKDIAEQNELAYKQGYKSIEDYFSQKAALEAEEAQLKVNALQEEIALVEALDTGGDANAEYQKNRDLIKLNGEMKIEQRNLNKKMVQLVEVGNAINRTLSNKTYQRGIVANTSSTSANRITATTTDELGQAMLDLANSAEWAEKEMYHAGEGCVEFVTTFGANFSNLLKEAADTQVWGMTTGTNDITPWLESKGVTVDYNVLLEDVLKSAKVGDILAVNGGKHAAIYVGDGTVLHNSSMSYENGDKNHIKAVGIDTWDDDTVNIIRTSEWMNENVANFGTAVQQVSNDMQESTEEVNNIVGQMPLVTTTLADAYQRMVKEGQKQLIDAQKEYAKQLNDPDLYQTISIVEIESTMQEKIDRARKQFENIPAIADTLEKLLPLKKLNVIVESAENAIQMRLKIMEHDAMAMNKYLREKTTLFPDAIRRYAEAFFGKKSDFGIGEEIRKLMDTFDEYSRLGFTGKAQEVMDKVFELQKKFVSMVDSWVSEMGEYFNYRRQLVEADSGLTSFVKEERKNQLDKGEARVKAVRYAEEASYWAEQEAIWQGEVNKLAERGEKIEGTKAQQMMQQAEHLKVVAMRQAEINAKLGEQKILWQETMDAANQALENGLYNFMTDYINTAESIGEAFRNMAIDILKDLQKFFAKKAITDLMHVITGTPNEQYNVPNQAEIQTAYNTNTMVYWLQNIYNAIGSLQAAQQTSMFSNMGGSIVEGTYIPNTRPSFTPNIGKHAIGGYISGKGTSTSDSIPAMLSNGEYVIKADAVRRYGLNFLDAVNNGHFIKMRTVIPRFADGGYVGDALQDTARGMTDFAKNLGTSVGVDNTISIALVRDEQEAIREWAKSPSGGQKFLVDFAKGNGRVFSRFNR